MRKTEPAEPKLSAKAFDRRSKLLAARFSKALGLAVGGVAFAPEITSATAVMALAGRASESIARNRGTTHHVVPLCRVSGDVLAWIGYGEFWRKDGAEQSFRFDQGGFTLHVGREGEVSKPQILRSEWIGRRSELSATRQGIRIGS